VYADRIDRASRLSALDRSFWRAAPPNEATFVGPKGATGCGWTTGRPGSSKTRCPRFARCRDREPYQPHAADLVCFLRQESKTQEN